MQLEGWLPVPLLHLLPQEWKLQVQLLQVSEGWFGDGVGWVW